MTHSYLKSGKFQRSKLKLILGDIVEISHADLSPETIITTAEDFALELDADRLVIPLKEGTLGWFSNLDS